MSAPVWVEAGFVAGQAQLGDIVAEVAPYALVVVALLVGFRMLVRYFRQAALDDQSVYDLKTGQKVAGPGRERLY